MSESQRDYELSISALRDEAHPHVDKNRVRERLVARGVLSGAAVSGAVASASAKAASGWGAASVLKLCAGLTVLSVVSVAVTQQTLREAPHRSLEHVLDGPLHARPLPVPAFVQHAREQVELPVVPSRRAVVHAPVHTSGPTSDVSKLARENALISAAVTALRAGDTARATSLLDQHEREFPAGFLRSERETARKRVADALRTGSTTP